MKFWLRWGGLGVGLWQMLIAHGAAEFRRLAEGLVKEHYDLRPLEAVALGWHESDGRFLVPDRDALRRDITRFKAADRQLAQVSTAGLSAAELRDFQRLKLLIAGPRWRLSELQEPWRNPMYYAALPDVSIYLKRDFAPLPDRIRHLTAILTNVPATFAAAREQLEPVLSRPLVETARDIASATADFLAADVAAEAAKVANPRIVTAFRAAQTRAVAEFRGYARWLETERLPNATAPFAIGEKAFREMLANELIELTPAEVLALGEQELKAEQNRFVATARVIDPQRSAAEVFQAIQREHPTEASLLPDTRRNLESIRAFVTERKLVTMPGEVRARVEPTLPPFRSTTFASMDTPGPFERRATEAYYYVTPVEPQWPEAQKQEWLTAFNFYTTDIVSIHEAYPGHYVQFLALNASPISDLAKVYVSYAFAEGWAHYCEQMVLDEGFARDRRPGESARDAEVRSAKYRLAQSSEALLRLCRLCVAVQLHCESMSEAEATAFFRENCYYAEKPAQAEARRGTYDPGYCFYTLGKLQLLKLRRDFQVQEGPAYTPRRFHDAVLSHGAPPFRLLREILLRDPASWPQTLNRPEQKP